MGYDALVISAHPDDAESQMGGTLAKLSAKGQRVLLVDLTDGEPTEFAQAGVRAQQADEAARILGVERLSPGLQDRFLADTRETRLQVARLIREHRPRWVYSTGEACVHPDHAAVVGLTRAAVFLARLGQWERVPGGEILADQDPWVVQRLFFPQSAPDVKQRRRRSARVSRRLRLLRAHGLIRKVAGTHRYHVTDYGRKAITAILAAQHATLNQLTPKAA